MAILSLCHHVGRFPPFDGEAMFSEFLPGIPALLAMFRHSFWGAMFNI